MRAPVQQLLLRRRWLSVTLLLLLAVLLLLLTAGLRRLADPADRALSRRVAIIGKKIRSQPVVNRASFDRLREPAGDCPPDTALLVLVTSALTNWERRQAVRDTWGGSDHLRVHVVFLLGDGEPDDTELLRTEADRHGDILQENFRDSYHNLTLKTMMGLRWAAERCPQAKFVVKTDDDIYWSLPLLMSHLDSLDEKRFITGCIKQLSAPPALSADGRPAPPGHPQFAAGAGYVVSGDLVADLYQAALRVPLLPVEDVFITGYCAKMAQAWPPKHHTGFSCGDILSDDCDLVQLFNAHKITPARQYLIWDKFSTEPNPCMDF
ncbi:beta-1,3-galactosyltransferase 1-like [Amphibalanus amphitrite]|uniref:beta-1,3-galactosyltransferase 1-like n=1 Tax=Amphibalanus amphitrite TaxID=1232801 RepID=UPI001C8FCB09|nr:beta-1,3-galactosyltransferase 1-like [Amphibalanus amphitrite]